MKLNTTKQNRQIHNTMNPIFRKKILLTAIAAGIIFMTGLVPLLQDHLKVHDQFKKITGLVLLSTGISQVGLDTTYAAQFNAHTLSGLKYPNTLYQGFLAIHYDEIDTALTFHSAAGRTFSGRFPGDINTLSVISRGSFSQSSQVDSHASVFTISGGSNYLKVKQNLYAVRDTSYRVFMDYIFYFYPRSDTDTVRFSNINILFGYDGDIGSTLGGYNNDSCGYYRDDSTKLVYVYDRLDSTKSLFAGLQKVSGGFSDSAGNKTGFHQTINSIGSTLKALDTTLYGMMVNPSFDTTRQNSDVMVYWTLKLSDKFTAKTRDTLTDTVRFVWVNGMTLENLINSAKGKRVNPPDIVPDIIKRPDKTRLLSNYPNPFNPGTRIDYELSSPGRVNITVYNVLGQRVREILNGFHDKAGAYHVYWDGKDDKGRSASAGMYIYRMKTDVVSLSRKCLLIK